MQMSAVNHVEAGGAARQLSLCTRREFKLAALCLTAKKIV